VITRTNNLNFLSELGIQAKVIALNIPRKINLLLDTYCLLKLILIFLMNRFSSVHSITPKAGLLAMLAASLTRVPFRIHTFTGQVWASSSGIKRIILKFFDTVIGLLTTHNLIDSPSQRDFLIKERVLNQAKTLVFVSGSVSGVDFSKFKANKPLGKKIKKELKIPQDAFVFIYLGRLVKDKGVLDLAKAFSNLVSFNVYLIFVGPDEDSLSDSIKEICANKILKIRLIGFSDTPYQYLSAADVICLPSYREGFGSVIIEAAAMGIPAVASNIYGITDAVVNNQTGLLHQVGDIPDIQRSMEQMLFNKRLLAKFSKAAKARALKEFDSKIITSAWVKFYAKHVH
jgi:glycosyltransferase involved in cell wall biosynthesis